MNTTSRDETLDSAKVVTNLVVPIFQSLPPPYPIQGREGALAYQIADEHLYYCDGNSWLLLGLPGAQGFQGYQGGQGGIGFQGAQGAQGRTGGQGAQGGSGFQGFQGGIGFQGSQGAQGISGAQGGSSIIYLNGSAIGSGIVGPQSRSVGVGQFGDDLAGTPAASSAPIWFRFPQTSTIDHMEVTMSLTSSSWPSSGTGTITVTLYTSLPPPDPVPPNPYTLNFTPTALTLTFPNITISGGGGQGVYSNSVTAAVAMPIGTLYGVRAEFIGAQPGDQLVVNMAVGLRVN